MFDDFSTEMPVISGETRCAQLHPSVLYILLLKKKKIGLFWKGLLEKINKEEKDKK